jgi:hypothetical protein
MKTHEGKQRADLRLIGDFIFNKYNTGALLQQSPSDRFI